MNKPEQQLQQLEAKVAAIKLDLGQLKIEHMNVLAECNGLRSMLTQTSRELQRLIKAAEAVCEKSVDTVEIVALRAVLTALREGTHG